jgi:hypothetical protein
MMAFAWFVWDHAHRGDASLGWLPKTPDPTPEPPRESVPGDSQGWLEQDAIGSYYAGIAEIGKRVHAGEPVPTFLLPKRSTEAPR